jgi:hypothetical protein
MRRLGDVGIRSAENGTEYRPMLAPAIDSRDGIDRSQSAVLREIALTLAGWVGFVVAVQLLLHALHIG